MTKTLLQYLFVITLFLSCAHNEKISRFPAAVKTKDCKKLLRYTLSQMKYDQLYKDYSNLKPYDTYKILINKAHLFEDVVFIKKEVIDGENFYVFAPLEDPHTGALYDLDEVLDDVLYIKENQLSGFSLTEKGVRKLKDIKNKNENLKKQNIELREYFLSMIYRLVTDKFKDIFRKENIEVITKSVSLNQYKELVADVSLDHIKYYEDFGFKSPKKVRFIIDNKKNYTGSPYYMKVRLFNMHEGAEKFSAIFLNPIIKNDTRIADPTIISHELSHNILFEQFHIKSFINVSEFVQEALADIMTANRLDNPKIFDNYLENGSALRELSKRVGTPGLKMHSIIPEKGISDHNLSLHVSHVLWNIRDILGQDQFSKELKPIIDDLNFYYPKFRKYLYKTLKVKMNHINDNTRFFYQYQFFLSVLLKRKWKSTDNKLIKEFLEEFIQKNQLSLKNIEKIKSNITKIEFDNSKSRIKIENRLEDINNEAIRMYDQLKGDL